MQPSKLSIADLFQPREQYLIPLFQRGYVWTLTHQIQPLWEDIVDRLDALREHRDNAMKVGGADKLKPLRKHFLGAIVVGGPVGADSEVIGTREVIDGQQRITTLQIMLFALRDVLKPHDDEALNDDVKTLTYNKGKYRSANDHLKVWPTNAGRDVIKIIGNSEGLADICNRFPVKDAEKNKIERPPMVQAYLFFYAMLFCLIRGKRFDDPMSSGEYGDEHTVARAVIRSIEKDNILKIPFADAEANLASAELLRDALQNCFQIMRLQLDAEDDPQIIFETLNARGAPLQPSDLIRNFIFLRASRNGEDVDALYEDFWRNFDEKADKEGEARGAKFWKIEERQGRLKNSRLDLLLYHYVGFRKRDDLMVGHVFEEFKEWWESGKRDSSRELKRLTDTAKYFETFIKPDQRSHLGRFCRRANLLDTATHTPLVFHLLEHHRPDDPDFIAAISDIESFLVRRFICGLTTKAYNRIFLNRLLAELVDEGKADAATLRSKLLALDGDSQYWPRDDEFAAAWSRRQLYRGSSTRKVRTILEGLEFALRTSKQEFLPDLDDLSVEHILPQKWKLQDYPFPDTTEAREARSRLLHCMGNLTLVTRGFNASLSNEAFRIKRPEIAANSSLMLNSYFQKVADADSWDEKAIIARAESLFPLALKTWPYPA
ncbi:DUF262 domain-containing protein [Bradyrhizobium sp. 187]|uniref:DUF262 domain-containing protein n=1 Tax=Bradyrhizobium sp. 187 TaxID=2782655 RepID=UPI0020003D47|nr:DUF262 domain-containing protein [Bradyrhizobium sp. 187]UPJ74104.1 DUF262 domain-containing protein [Bradyrhizobium sp. 187]